MDVRENMFDGYVRQIEYRPGSGMTFAILVDETGEQNFNIQTDRAQVQSVIETALSSKFRIRGEIDEKTGLVSKAELNLAYQKISLNERLYKQTSKSKSGTKYSEHKNRSAKDTIENVQLVFSCAKNACVDENNLIEVTLGPKEKARIVPMVNGAPVNIVSFHVRWKLKGSPVSGSTRSADPGYFYESIRSECSSDGSTEIYYCVQRRL